MASLYPGKRVWASNVAANMAGFRAGEMAKGYCWEGGGRRKEEGGAPADLDRESWSEDGWKQRSREARSQATENLENH